MTYAICTRGAVIHGDDRHGPIVYLLQHRDEHPKPEFIESWLPGAVIKSMKVAAFRAYMKDLRALRGIE